MNILLITHERNLNGASKSLLNIIEQLKEKHKFYVLTPFSDGQMIEELKKRKIVFFSYPLKRWEREKDSNLFIWFLRKCRWYMYDRFVNTYCVHIIEKNIRELSIDLIHTNVSVLNIGGLLSKRMNIPHIWHIREFGQEDFGLYPLCSEKYMYNFISRYSDKIIVISKAIKNKYEPLLSNKNILLVYNGVGNENLYKNRVYMRPKITNFLISGTIRPEKGQLTAIMACKELVQNGITDFHLFIAGRGKCSELKEIFKEQDKYVSFLGQVDDLHIVRRKMDVELVCSRSEAFGRVTIEAMMAGMPVIGSNAGGTPELIIEGYNGMLYPFGDYHKLSACMKKYIENYEMISEHGKNGQDLATKNFAIERCANEIENIYESFITKEDF